jgi:hypothetical protein
VVYAPSLIMMQQVELEAEQEEVLVVVLRYKQMV